MRCFVITVMQSGSCALTGNLNAGVGVANAKNLNYGGSYQSGQGYDSKFTVSYGKPEIPKENARKLILKAFGKGCYTW